MFSAVQFERGPLLWTSFAFDGDLGSFTLDDGDSFSQDNLDQGSYNVYEEKASFPDNHWALLYVKCEAEQVDPFYPTVGETDDIFGVDIPLAEDQDLTCTFHNERVNLADEDDKGNRIYLPIVVK